MKKKKAPKSIKALPPLEPYQSEELINLLADFILQDVGNTIEGLQMRDAAFVAILASSAACGTICAKMGVDTKFAVDILQKQCAAIEAKQKKNVPPKELLN